jgi:proline iminopeptidase
MPAMRFSILFAACSLIGVVACRERKTTDGDSTRVAQQAVAAPPGEGMLPVPGGRIWYKKSGHRGGLPVILVHGGPGFSSYYLKSLEALGADRPVIRYDQLGGGKSDKMTDTSLFTVQHFVRELDSLRAALGYEKVHILGHSWGTIVAYEYYRAYPNHVASIVFGSPCLDIPAYEKRARSLVATLSDSAQKAIMSAEATRRYDAPSYQNAINEFYGRYVFRHPVEADLDSSFKTLTRAFTTSSRGRANSRSRVR